MELTKVEISSTNANTEGQLEQLAKVGDTVTLTVESSEALKSLSVGDGLAKSTSIQLNPVGESGREWTLSATLSLLHVHTIICTSVHGDGVVKFKLFYEDLKGNKVWSDGITTNNSKVTVKSDIDIHKPQNVFTASGHQTYIT
tara:strand:- start:451 stop:879 length:429 start_codon:yes stop_codon:yes gene_type:complete